MRLHPAIYWSKTESGFLQLRLPTGNHVTIDENVEEVEDLLNSLASGEDEKSKNTKLGELADDLVNILLRLNAIFIEQTNEKIGTFKDFADYHARVVNSRIPRRIDLRTGKIGVYGNGAIADVVRKVVDRLDQGNGKLLRISCADFEDASFFEGQNREALLAEEQVTFIRWSRERLIVGPPVLTKNGPCYSCYVRRLVASATHVPEMKAMFKPQNGEYLRLDFAFESMVNFAIARHL